jgi:hypothetical protein
VVSNFSLVIYFLVPFPLQLFNVILVERNRAIEQMRDWILVLDAKTVKGETEYM